YGDSLSSKAANGIIENNTLGDWCPWSTETPSQLTATAFYYEDARIVSRAATILGNTNDAEKYFALAKKIKNKFNERFFNATNDSYANNSQTALATALYFGLVPENQSSAVLSNLTAQVETLKHIDTGILG